MSIDPQIIFTIWFAGFYEGEGSISNDKQNRNRIHLSVSQNDRTPLDKAKEKWGGTIRKRTRKSPASEKICVGYEWTVRAKLAEKFVSDISPYLIVPYKINQITTALDISKQEWEETFKCNFCDKTYTDPSGRRRHEVKEHIKKGEQHTCTICGNEYKSKDTLNRHIKQHTSIASSEN